MKKYIIQFIIFSLFICSLFNLLIDKEKIRVVDCNFTEAKDGKLNYTKRYYVIEKSYLPFYYSTKTIKTESWERSR